MNAVFKEFTNLPLCIQLDNTQLIFLCKLVIKVSSISCAFRQDKSEFADTFLLAASLFQHALIH